MLNQPLSIYYITHIDNLKSIVSSGKILSDAKRIADSIDSLNIGMSKIKQRRLSKDVSCHLNTKLGQYVPFYFCPRSIMLYIISQRNHHELTYKGGQERIIHLVINASDVIKWATENNIKWAFSDRNAADILSEFYSDAKLLNKINWQAVESNDFRDHKIKESKQAEFLLYDFMPWHFVSKIGVYNSQIQDIANKILYNVDNKPKISIEKFWYF